MLFNDQLEDGGIPSDLTSLIPKDDDTGVHATFYVAKVHMGFKSREAGYPIYEDQEFVRILVKGNDKMMVERPATIEDKQRFQYQYAKFKEGESQLKSGTPLTYLPGVSPATAAEFERLNIRTVQDLAEVGDNVLDNLGVGGRTLRDRARAFVGEEPVAVRELRNELEEKDKLLTSLSERLRLLEESLSRGERGQASESTPRKPRKRRLKNGGSQ